MTDNVKQNETAPRDWRAALKTGFRMRCPACGEGHMFHRFLKVSDCCPHCGEELHHHRADDAPPYFTILVVAHVIGALMLFVEEHNDALDVRVHMVLWPVLTLLLVFWFLPRFKGALIAYQWALRMHGFETVQPRDSKTAT
ncbi:MAG: hypothetical protein RIQ68_1557 [Pseudomonadota bacterium]